MALTGTPRICARLLIAVGAALALCPIGHVAIVAIRAQDVPAATAAGFLRDVKANLKRDQQLLSHYSYFQRRSDVRVSRLGKITTGPVKVYEVAPSMEPGGSHRRLISIDGVPLTPEQLAAQDRRRQQEIAERLEKLKRETPQQLRARLEKEVRQAREEQDMVDELFDMFNFKVTGREQLNDMPALVVSFTPKPGARPRTDRVKYLRRFHGRAWVHETERQVMRVDVEALDDISFGFGLVARLHKGSRGTFERRKVNGETWLPVSARFTGNGRALLVRKWQLEIATEFFGYRKFGVETRTDFAPPG